MSYGRRHTVVWHAWGDAEAPLSTGEVVIMTAEVMVVEAY
jgi:hypothetical protein